MFSEQDVLEGIAVFIFACVLYYITCAAFQQIWDYIKKKITKDKEYSEAILVLIAFAIFIIVIALGIMM